jgi:hypothetical protein
MTKAKINTIKPALGLVRLGVAAITAVYQRYRFTEERRKALQDWAEFVAKL